MARAAGAAVRAWGRSIPARVARALTVSHASRCCNFVTVDKIAMSSISPSTLEHLRGSVWPALESSLNLPRGLLEAIAYWETRGAFDDKVSSAGARGIFQLTPIAIAQIRKDHAIAVDPSNPYQSSYGAAYLLARYFRLFHGLAPLYIAAYNSGEGTVKKFIRDVAAQGKGFLSRETREYLRNVLPLIGG